MNWSDVAGAVGRSAPILGTLIGGPAGAAIGSLVAAALGTAATPDAVRDAVAADPAAALKLAQVESENKVKLQEMLFTHAEAEMAANVSLRQAEVDDRKSARNREIETKDSLTPQILAGIVVACSVAMGVAIVGGWVTRDPIMQTLLGTVVGYIFGESKQVLAYFFGSSAGSAAKSKQLAKVTPAVEPNTADTPP